MKVLWKLCRFPRPSFGNNDEDLMLFDSSDELLFVGVDREVLSNLFDGTS